MKQIAPGVSLRINWNFGGSMAVFNKLNQRLLGLVLLAFLCANNGVLAEDTASNTNLNAKPTFQDLKLALEKSDANPANPKLRFDYAQLLFKMGKHKQAAKEFIAVTDIDASYYLAYHMIALHCSDAQLLKEATKRLSHLKESKPKDLMLRVALSELLEAQGDYYRASRALVDLVFLNAIPDKYRKKVDARIVFLQAKARDAHADRHSATHHHTDSVNTNPPLPEETITRGITASKVKSNEQNSSIGNVPIER